MRRLLASVLLLCVGLSLPAAGGPLCLCVAGWFEDASGCCDCCDHCGSDCSDECPWVESLPEAPAPESPTGLPPVPVMVLGNAATALPDSPSQSLLLLDRAAPIRGPTTGPPPRAMLAIWRL